MQVKSPDISDLPQSPPGKQGWPWTKGCAKLSFEMANGSLWPRISIVTPSFNQGHFLEETIRSVLLQGYPNLEYIIVDGGSTDCSVEIIKKYDRWLTYWASEPDKGQSDALNKGFSRVSGEILAYINSDDLYEPDAFKSVAKIFANRSETQLVAGECVIFSGNTITGIFKPKWPHNLDHLLTAFGSTFAQPASFWHKEVYHKVEGFNEDSHYCFDREFFLKIGLLGYKPYLVSKRLARYRDHKHTKTRRTIYFFEEAIPLVEKYAAPCGVSDKKKRALIRQNHREINYLKVFITWKRKGRFSALVACLGLLVKSPTLIRKRKILGLIRRLLFFKNSRVVELGNI